MDILDQIAEARIQEALRAGELSNLPGSGKPLQLDDDSMIPKELRAAYRILRNSGFLPPEIQLRKEIMRLNNCCCTSRIRRSALAPCSAWKCCGCASRPAASSRPICTWRNSTISNWCSGWKGLPNEKWWIVGTKDDDIKNPAPAPAGYSPDRGWQAWASPRRRPRSWRWVLTGGLKQEP